MSSFRVGDKVEIIVDDSDFFLKPGMFGTAIDFMLERMSIRSPDRAVWIVLLDRGGPFDEDGNRALRFEESEIKLSDPICGLVVDE